MASDQISPWTGHPLLTKAQLAPRAMDIHLQFRVWEPKSKTYLTLPAGVGVDLMASVFGPDDLILSEQTDAQGAVHFHLPNVTALSDPDADVYFVVNSNALVLQGTFQNVAYTLTLPSTWSTEGGWRTDDGTLIERIPFNPVGSAAVPLVYTLGLNYCFCLKYSANVQTGSGTTAPQTFPVLRGTRYVLEFSGGLTHKTIITGTVGRNGLIEGTSFDVWPQSTPIIILSYKTDSGTEDFPGIDGVKFDSFNGGAGYTVGAPEQMPAVAGKTTIGTRSSPHQLLINNTNSSSILYCMKNTAELSHFIRNMVDTSGTWSWHDLLGVEVLTGVPPPTSGSTSVSLPFGNVYYMKDDNFDRMTHIHEMAHQIMWDYGDFTTLGILTLYLGPHANMRHYQTLYAHPTHALLEGWAEFIALLFTWDKPGYYDVSASVSSAPFPNAGVRPELIPGQPWLYPPIKIGWPPSWGEHVEGMFAAGLLELVRRYVIEGSGLPLLQPVIPDAGGNDLSGHLPWLWASSPEAKLARERFTNVIMKPLLSLQALSAPTSTDFIESIRSNNPVEWPNIRGYLHGFALAFPTLDEWGTPAGRIPVSVSAGTSLDVGGKHFRTTGFMEIRIAASPIAGTSLGASGPYSLATVTVHDMSSATIIIPPEPVPNTANHTYHLQLWTPDGMDVVENVIIYP
jgi:hypothetical protein